MDIETLFTTDWYHIAGYIIIGIIFFCCCGLCLRYFLPKDPNAPVKRVFPLDYINPLSLKTKESIVFTFINPPIKLKRRDRRKLKQLQFEIRTELQNKQQQANADLSADSPHKSYFGFTWNTTSPQREGNRPEDAVCDDTDLEAVWADRRRIFRREKIASRRSKRLEQYALSHPSSSFDVGEEMKRDPDIENGQPRYDDSEGSSEEEDALYWWKFEHGKKRRNEIIESRQERRRSRREEKLTRGEIDHVAINSGPPPSSIPHDFCIAMVMPDMSRLSNEGDSAAPARRILYWWKDTDWFSGAIIGRYKGEDAAYRVKFDRTETDSGIVFNGVRKVRLTENGEDGYFRRWVLLVPTRQEPWEQQN